MEKKKAKRWKKVLLTIPLAASFSKSGMRDDWLAAFMMSSILLNPQLILYYIVNIDGEETK